MTCFSTCSVVQLVKLTLRGTEEFGSGPLSTIPQQPATQHAELTISDAGFGDSRSIASDTVDWETFDRSKVPWLEAVVMRLLLVVFCGLTAVPASSLATFCNNNHIHSYNLLMALLDIVQGYPG